MPFIDQIYVSVEPVLAFSVTPLPVQIAVPPAAVIVAGGNGFVLTTVTGEVFVQPVPAATVRV